VVLYFITRHMRESPYSCFMVWSWPQEKRWEGQTFTVNIPGFLSAHHCWPSACPSTYVCVHRMSCVEVWCQCLRTSWCIGSLQHDFPSLIGRQAVGCDLSLVDTGSQVMPVCGVLLLYSDEGCQKFPTWSSLAGMLHWFSTIMLVYECRVGSILTL
jgi:hypothetical protein